MLTLVFSMDALGAFPIACRCQWRTPNTRVRTMHVEHQMENMFPPKAEMQYWGHCGIGNVLPKIVKLPSMHQRLTRQKMRMDNQQLVEKKRSCEFRKKRSFSQERFFSTRGYPCASFGTWGADECSELWQSSEGHCLSRNVSNTASPLLGGNMFSIWCSTCIVRTRVLGVRHWRLQAIGKTPRASMLNTKVSNK